MARTPQQILEQATGALMTQNAVLIARVEALEERIADLESRLAATNGQAVSVP